MKKLLIGILLSLMTIITSSPANAVEMEDYCIIPPYVKRDLKPNILLYMDNAEINGQPAYKGYDLDPLTNDQSYIQADGSIPEAPGIFKENIWYSYTGTKFFPDENGQFEGNLLNWVTTSMYDIIQAILVGGKSTSRQTNVNTLVGYSSGDWPYKVYVYEGEDSKMYACEFGVNETGKSNLTVHDSTVYYLNMGYVCGLLLDPPVRPAPAYRLISSLSGPEGDAQYAGVSDPVPAESVALVNDKVAETAAAEETGSARSPIKQAAVDVLNAIFGSVAEPAYAAKPVSIITPKEGAILTNAVTFESYPVYIPVASGGDGVYVWTISGLPGGMTYDVDTGAISGTPVIIGTYSLTFACASDGKTDSVSATLIVEGNALKIVSPNYWGERIHDVIFGEPYTGYELKATGGTGNYTWSVVNLPPGMTVDASTGLIGGTPTGPYGEDTYYNVYPVVTDGLTTVSGKGGIIVRVSPIYITNFGGELPKAIIGEPYEGFNISVKQGLGPVAQYKYAVTGRPPGIEINTSTGEVYGTPTGPPGIYNVRALVYDLGRPGVFRWSPYNTIEVVYSGDSEVKMAWPSHEYLAEEGNYIGSVTKGETYPLPDGYRQFHAVGGNPWNYSWLMLNEPSGLEVIKHDTDFDTSVLYGKSGGSGGSFYPTLSVTDGVTGDFVDLTMIEDPLGTLYSPMVMYPDPWTLEYMPDGYVGEVYNGFAMLYDFGTPNIQCTASNLPPGLYINQDNCTVLGRPTTTWDDTFTINYTDEALVWDFLLGTYVLKPVSGSTTGKIRIYEDQDLRITYPTNSTAQTSYIGALFELQPVVVDFVEPLSWEATGLDPGLTIDPSTGLIKGVLKYADYSGGPVTIKVTDARGQSATVSFLLYIKLYYKPKSLGITTTIVLPEATVGSEYVGYTIAGLWGITGTYIFEGYNMPPGMWIDRDTGMIQGVPKDGTAGTWQMSICAGDAIYNYDNYIATGHAELNYWCNVNVYIDIADAAYQLNSETFNIRVCVGDYVDNCETTTKLTELKHGLLQDYWDQARFGLLDFDIKEDPMIDMCLPSTTQPPFFTAVENAVPVGITKLVDGEYMAVQLFEDASAADSSCSDVFENDPSACRNNFILMLTSGEGANNPPVPTNTVDPMVYTDLPEVCEGATWNISKNACYGYEQDLRPDKPGTQRVSTYVVNAMGSNGEKLAEAASYSGGLYYYATNASKLKSQIEQALKDIIKRATSGTAASVLASGEGSGSNIIQAIYYPRRRFKDSQNLTFDEIWWIGKLSGFWYYTDPFFSMSDIREDTESPSSPSEAPNLNLLNDYVIQPFFNTTSETVEAVRMLDTTGTGGGDEIVDVVPFDTVKSLWEAGKMLWERDLDADPRTIYVNLNDAKGVPMPLLTNGLAYSDAKLQQYLTTSTPDEAEELIRWVHGYDVDGYRSRSVKVDSDGDGETLSAGEDVRHVWKLGDVLNSSPRIAAAGVKPNKYDTDYGDGTYKAYFNNSTSYTNRGMVYAGGNDGMLHAFKLGYLKQASGYTRAYLYNSPASTMDPAEEAFGYEQWAFVPKNVLPYLKYTAREDYCHLYLVDQTVTIIDASLCTAGSGADVPAALCLGNSDDPKGEDSWRTILVGGMRYGGACKSPSFVCDSSNTIDQNGDGVVDDDDCVKAPLQTTDGIIGLSSYFALDITDEDNPTLLWEFSDSDLGMSTSGVTVARFNSKDASGAADKTTLGKWYALFGSGPTGPIDKSSNQLVAASDQNLKLFALDLGTGVAEAVLDTGVEYAFTTAMGKISNDFDPDGPTGYETDVIYIGYTSKCSGLPLDTGAACPEQTWRNGGVLRVLTGDGTSSGLPPSQWKVAKLIDNIGPVSGSVGRLQNIDPLNGAVWVYVGTGRYFYERVEPWTGFTNAVSDDSDTVRNVIGLRDPCYSGQKETPFLDVNCNEQVSLADLKDVTNDPFSVDTGGWYVNLFPPYVDTLAGKTFGAERVITDVLTTMDGKVFIASFAPYSDECSIGGESYMWAFEYDTGAVPKFMQGILILQVSTGLIKKVDLSEDFGTGGDDRRTSGEPGVVGKEPAVPVLPGGGEKKILHIYERR